MKSRYTVSGTEKIDTLINHHMEIIREHILSRLGAENVEAVILGGGYGRGEGGVFREGEEESLFNDYDLFIITRPLSFPAKRRLAKESARAAEELSEMLNFEVDIGVPLSIKELPRLPFTLMFYELKMGHTVIYGREDILNATPGYDETRLPLWEGVKLLLNRGAGLLMSRKLLARETLRDEEMEFITRNIYKALMASGDVVLMMNGVYCCSYVKRIERFKKLPPGSLSSYRELAVSYEEAVSYKLNPRKAEQSQEELARTLEGVVDIMAKVYPAALERCLGRENSDKRESLSLLAPGSGQGRSIKEMVKNIVLNLLHSGPAFSHIRWMALYPRQRLLYTLPFILFGWDPGERQIGPLLGTAPGDDREKQTERFLHLWRRFN